MVDSNRPGADVQLTPYLIQQAAFGQLRAFIEYPRPAPGYLSNASRCCRPESPISSHTAFESTQMWCFTVRKSPPSVINPAGTNIRDSSFVPGTGEPHIRQKEICQSASGFSQEVTWSSPRIHRKSEFSMTTTAIPLLPVARRQIEQWQTNTSERLALISNLIEPQLHSPSAIQ